jgi:hypothetical protein
LGLLEAARNRPSHTAHFLLREKSH